MRWRALPATSAAMMVLAFLAPPRPALAGGGCHGDLRDARGTAVDLSMMCFAPMVTRIDPGQRVTWTNKDSMPHTVTTPISQWGSPNSINPGESVTYGFDFPGTFPYACILHPGMVGAVVRGDGLSQASPALARPVSAERPGVGQAPHRSGWRWQVGIAIAVAVFIATGFAVVRGRREGHP